MFFSDRGVGVAASVLANLEPVKIYEEPVAEGGHSTGTTH